MTSWKYKNWKFSRWIVENFRLNLMNSACFAKFGCYPTSWGRELFYFFHSPESYSWVGRCVRACVCVYSICARVNETLHNSVLLGETFLGAKTGTLIRMQRLALLFGLLLRCFVSDFIGAAILSACTRTHTYGQRKLMEQQRRKHTRTQNPCVKCRGSLR